MDVPKMHALAVETIDQYLDSSWSLVWERTESHAGLCDHDNKIIYLNASVLASYSKYEVEQVVLHEVAHALVGPGKGHGSTWKAKAREIGYEGGQTVREASNLGDWALRISFLFALAAFIWPGVLSFTLAGVWVALMTLIAWQLHKPMDQQYDNYYGMSV